MNGTPAILQYLGKLYGMYPEDKESEAHAWQVQINIFSKSKISSLHIRLMQ